MVNVVTVLLLVMSAQEGVKIPKGTLYRVPEPRVFQFDGSGKNSMLYREDFETGASGWTITNGVWEIGSPSYGPDTAHGGSSWAATVLDGNYPNNANTRLISPSINLPALPDSMSHLMLSFWHWFQIESRWDNGYVEISTDGGSSWTQVGSSVSGDGSSWRQYTVMLDQFAGQTIIIGFRFTSDGSVTYAGWYIDDVAVVLLQPEPVNVEIRNISTGMFPFVFLTVSADTFGAPIYTLDETNFQVFENGVSQTDYFEVTPPDTSGGVRAVDIVFCMDNSGSMDDEIAGVSQHVADFVQQLQQSGYDFALGLVRFGGWENSGYPIVEDNGLLTSDINYFINDLWARNYADGSFEPGWDAMVSAATQMHWRPGSQKVIVLITDESPQDNGNYGNYTYDQTVQILTQNNARVFAMIDPSEAPHSPDDYGTIARTTGGDWFDIQSPMDSLLNAIGGAITSTYVIRYRASDTTYAGQREVVVRLTYDGNSDEDTTYYTAGSAPQIILTDSTRNLINNLTLVQGQEVDVTVYAVDHIPPDINYVRLYYRHHGDASYQVVDMTNEHDSLYAATIPSTVVDTPGIEFYFEASDSLTTVTLPSTNPHTNPFVVAVWPNYAPFIFHIPPSSGSTIQALVFDNTNNIEHVWLFFREVGTIVWDSVEMTVQQTGTIADLASVLGVTASEVVDSANARGLPLTATHTASIYEGTIGCATTNGAEYYIKAMDNWGIAGFHGLPDDPHVVGGSHVDFLMYYYLKSSLIDSFTNHTLYQSQERVIDSYVETIKRNYDNGTSTPEDEEAVARLALSENVALETYNYADSMANLISPLPWDLVGSFIMEQLFSILDGVLNSLRDIPFIGQAIGWFLDRVDDITAIFDNINSALMSEFDNRLSHLLESRIHDPQRRNEIINNLHEHVFDPLSEAAGGVVGDAVENPINIPSPEDIVSDIVEDITRQGLISIYEFQTSSNFDSMYVWATDHDFNVGNFTAAEDAVQTVMEDVYSTGISELETVNRGLEYGDFLGTLATLVGVIGAIAAIIFGIMSCPAGGLGCILAAIGGFSGWTLIMALQQSFEGAQTVMRILTLARGTYSEVVSYPELVQEGTFASFDKLPPKQKLMRYQELYAHLEPLQDDWCDSLYAASQQLSSLIDSSQVLISMDELDSLQNISDELSIAIDNFLRMGRIINSQIIVGSYPASLVDSTFDSLYTAPSLGAIIHTNIQLESALLALSFAPYVNLTYTQLDTINSVLNNTRTALFSVSSSARAAIEQINRLGITIPPIVIVENLHITRSSSDRKRVVVSADIKNLSRNYELSDVAVSISRVGDFASNMTPLTDTAFTLPPGGTRQVSWQIEILDTLRRSYLFRILPVPINQTPMSFRGASYIFSVSLGVSAQPQPLSNNTVFAYPDPFNPTLENATISYSLSKGGDVTIRIYDVAMNLVRTLIKDQPQQPGQHTVTWDGKDEKGETVANGIYFFVIESSAGERGAGKIAVKK